MNRGPELFNVIRNVLAESGVCEQIADRVVTEVGELYLGAIHDAVREHVDEGVARPRQGHLGMTAAEAAMRWCPHVREVTPVGKSKKDAQIGNRFIDRDGSHYSNPAGCGCISDHCMMWRSLDQLRGYCGLASRPHYQPLSEPRQLASRTPLERPTESEQQDLFAEP
jgi:hypothetical protein